MLKGKVRSFDEQKGFGFISSEGLPDTFVFFSAIKTSGFKTLTAGQQVTFQVAQGEKGPQAINVEIIEDDDQDAE
ncbi:hypothetical protein FC15_GL000581 [Lapidilactobacillus concavus DSM 17758]|jgi:CspA family cold shock protein|uniref:CSD domain-containing protein n=1 Tax=Lapidilactobacillus concavus DSM 17758 TaxID=1423735 RepID=A0A0R1VRY3_9LACO|nr:cold-shock protein [Lapidilactobacillus concavus]KRM08512.1 hypothetical protein FC15_GL000581 [Lapidilactobacillus concavus DSM 17758]GEL13033.1 cold-shock protein [Lapidilactobacillus concavus]